MVTIFISVVTCLAVSQILLAVQISKLMENRVFLEKVKYTTLKVILDELRKYGFPHHKMRGFIIL